MRLKDRVAIVTGGGSGFGEGIARRFAQEGAKIVVSDINGEGAKRVADVITQQGGNAIHIKGDVAKHTDVKAMVKAAVDAHGRIDIMVNNAGVTHRNQPMLDVPEEMFDKIFAVNVKAIYLSSLEVVPLFRKQGGGVIINTASTAGVRPRPGLTWYNGSKGAAVILTKSMAVELAPKNIRVNAINPVMGETGMLEQFMGADDTPDNRARFLAGIPLGRLSRPEDIANAALFFADPASEFITGVCLEVDGGRCV
jgi:3-oxoacyl-[acyl-carrier protein] reductase